MTGMNNQLPQTLSDGLNVIRVVKNLSTGITARATINIKLGQWYNWDRDNIGLDSCIYKYMCDTKFNQ